MKDLLAALLLVCAVSAETPAPYPAGGARRPRPSFTLPEKVANQNPQYLPPLDPRNPSQVSPEQDISVQGLPVTEQTPQFQLSPISGQQYVGPTFNADLKGLDERFRQSQTQQQTINEITRQRQLFTAPPPSQQTTPKLPNQFIPRTIKTSSATTENPKSTTPDQEEIYRTQQEVLTDEDTRASAKQKVSVEVTKQNIQEYPPEIFLAPLAQLRVQGFAGQPFGQLVFQPSLAQASQRQTASLVSPSFDGLTQLSALQSVLYQRQLEQQSQQNQQLLQSNQASIQQGYGLGQPQIQQYQLQAMLLQPAQLNQEYGQPEAKDTKEDDDDRESVEDQNQPQYAQQPQLVIQHHSYQPQEVQFQNGQNFQPQQQTFQMPQQALQSQQTFQTQQQVLQMPQQSYQIQQTLQPQQQAYQPQQQTFQSQESFQPQQQTIQPQQQAYQPQQQTFQSQETFQPQQQTIQLQQQAYQPQQQTFESQQTFQPQQQTTQPQHQAYQPQQKTFQPQQQTYQPQQQTFQPQQHTYQPEQQQTFQPQQHAYQPQQQTFQMPQQTFQPQQIYQYQQDLQQPHIIYQPAVTQDLYRNQVALQSGLDPNMQGNDIDDPETNDEEENQGGAAVAVATAFGERTRPKVSTQYGVPEPRIQSTTNTSVQNEDQEPTTEAEATTVANGTMRKSTKLRSRRVRPLFTLDNSGHLVLVNEQEKRQ